MRESGQVARKFLSYRIEVLPAEVSTETLHESRRAFYAGVAVCIGEIGASVGSIDSSKDINSKVAEILRSLDAKLRTLAEEVAAFANEDSNV